MNITEMRRELIRDEGIKTKPYKCSAGRWTIGCGRNISDKGIDRMEAMYLLDNDIAECEGDLRHNVFSGWDFRQWPEETQRALVNMRFQLGSGGFRSFEKMIKAIKLGDWSMAAHEAADSRWAQQTPERAARIIKILRETA